MSEVAGQPGNSDVGGEPDSDQLPLEDTLVDRGISDVLDEGYSPPERDRVTHYGETAWEQAHHEPHQQRLDREEPEEWVAPVRDARDTHRAGRLVGDTDAEQGRGNDVFAVDEGLSGGGASAEEAAMHIVEVDSVTLIDDLDSVVEDSPEEDAENQDN